MDTCTEVDIIIIIIIIFIIIINVHLYSAASAPYFDRHAHGAFLFGVFVYED